MNKESNKIFKEKLTQYNENVINIEKMLLDENLKLMITEDKKTNLIYFYKMQLRRTIHLFERKMNIDSKLRR